MSKHGGRIAPPARSGPATAGRDRGDPPCPAAPSKSLVGPRGPCEPVESPSGTPQRSTQSLSRARPAKELSGESPDERPPLPLGSLLGHPQWALMVLGLQAPSLLSRSHGRKGRKAGPVPRLSRVLGLHPRCVVGSVPAGGALEVWPCDGPKQDARLY